MRIKLKRSVLKEEYVALTGNADQAILLNHLIELDARYDDWFLATPAQLSRDTMLNVSDATMRKRIKDFVGKNWLAERKNPSDPLDRRLQYRVQSESIENDLKKLEIFQ